MKLAIMQPYFFPYIGYFQLIKEVDKFVIYDDVNFINKGWINRNNILISGEARLFTIPLQHASQNSLIKEISIVRDLKWKNKLVKTLEAAYKRAAYYDVVIPIIHDIIDYESAHISEHIVYSIRQLKDYLKLDTEIIPTSSVYNNTILKGQNRILDICVQEGATTYVNPIGGTALYSEHLFKEKKINLKFIKTGKVLYKQYNNLFVPSLSIIDVLMFNSRDTISEFMSQYELIDPPVMQETSN